jgi:hypothetical protein
LFQPAGTTHAGGVEDYVRVIHHPSSGLSPVANQDLDLFVDTVTGNVFGRPTQAQPAGIVQRGWGYIESGHYFIGMDDVLDLAGHVAMQVWWVDLDTGDSHIAPIGPQVPVANLPVTRLPSVASDYFVSFQMVGDSTASWTALDLRSGATTELGSLNSGFEMVVGSELWVAGPDDGCFGIDAQNIATHATRTLIHDCAAPMGLAYESISPDGASLYLLAQSGSFPVYNAFLNIATGTLTTVAYTGLPNLEPVALAGGAWRIEVPGSTMDFAPDGSLVGRRTFSPIETSRSVELAPSGASSADGARIAALSYETGSGFTQIFQAPTQAIDPTPAQLTFIPADHYMPFYSSDSSTIYYLTIDPVGGHQQLFKTDAAR